MMKVHARWLVLLIGCSVSLAAAAALQAADGAFTNMYAPLLRSSTPVQGSLTVAQEQTAGAGEELVSYSSLCRLPGASGLFCAQYLYVVPEGTAIKADSGQAGAKTIDQLFNLTEGQLVWSNLMAADHVGVRLRPDSTREKLQASLPEKWGLKVGTDFGDGLFAVELQAGGLQDIEGAVAALSALTDVVATASPDYIGLSFAGPPNDPLYTTDVADLTKQWYLPKIHAQDAWTLHTDAVGNMNIVAVLDTGVDFAHPDLTGNMWSAANGNTWNKDYVDSAGNGSDKSGHGTHVAGIIGAMTNTTPAMGVAGVCWTAQMITMRVIPTSGAVSSLVATAAIQDVNRLNATTGFRVAVANESWGINGFDINLFNELNQTMASTATVPGNTLTAAWQTATSAITVSGPTADIAFLKKGLTVSAPGLTNTIPPTTNVPTMVLKVGVPTVDPMNPSNSIVKMVVANKPKMATGTGRALTFSNPITSRVKITVHVAAAGDSNNDLDQSPVYPASFPSSLVVSVGATDHTDVKLGGTLAPSNFGQCSVDLFAPGEQIWSTYFVVGATPSGFIPQGSSTTEGYLGLTGSSMAAAQVSGAIALLRLQSPSLDAIAVRTSLLTKIDAIAGLSSISVTGGRLSLHTIFTP